MGDFKIELGVIVTDSITGFEGQVTGRVDYVTGCRQYLVQPRVKGDGTLVDPHWFDEERVQGKAQVSERSTKGFGEPAPTK